ncbi:MAG: flagellin [Proteobacteria bacterium]|nr:flagellin [Pseudomonadota bacterium]
MGLRIKSNIESQVAQRRVGESRKNLGESFEKLASGQRVNKSADDAAGLAVSERIRAKTRSLDVAKRNANDGISYIQVAEGGLNETTNIVVRMRELTSQAASDTIGNREREFLNKEFQQLRQEVARIVDSTEFNGAKVLKLDEQKPMKIFVGASNRGSDQNGDAPEIDEENDPDVLTVDLKDLAYFRDALSSVVDNDLSIVPSDEDGGAADLGPDGTNDVFNKLDTMLDSMASYRAVLGSVQSRLNSTITNVDITSENLNAAQSRIRDVDYAAETAKLATNRILTQAGVSVLAQANQNSEFALQLLR